MNHKLIQTLFITCLTLATFCLLNPAHAAEAPRMNKAIELLEEAKTASNKVAVLEKAKAHVENTEHGNKGGRRYSSINKIEKAIAAVNKGNDATALIDEAIALLGEGIEIQKGNKGKKKKG